MENKYLISIIIPTRNRQIYAFECVKYILSLNLNIQIIITDNSDDEQLKMLLNDYIDDSILKYLYISKRIACIDNYETAASMVEGEFFCAIGDDDTILPFIVDVALWMKKNSIDAVKYSTNLNYWWPQKNAKLFDKRHKGCVWCDGVAALFRKIDTAAGVVELLKNGCQNYLSLDLAKTYHGLVKTSRMLEIKKQSGRFYGGCSPDIYSAVCLSLLDNLCCYEIGIPFTLPGVCIFSTSADSEKGKHAGQLENAPQFIGMSKPYEWDDLIPKYYTVQTIWAETAIKAIKSMGKDDLILKHFNAKKLINAMLINNPNHRDQIVAIVGDVRETEQSTTIKTDSKIKRTFYRMAKLFNGKIMVKTKCLSINIAAKKICSFVKRRLKKPVSLILASFKEN